MPHGPNTGRDYGLQRRAISRYIGATRYANLFLNTGHGTLGWTHACGSGRAITDIMGGRRPEIDFAFTAYSSERLTRSAGAPRTGVPLRPL
jgi:hypothetical protein